MLWLPQGGNQGAVTMELDDRKPLNLIQSQFPMVDRPSPAMEHELGIGEEGVPERLCELKCQNVARQIDAIFDTRRLVHKTTLVAFPMLVKTSP